MARSNAPRLFLVASTDAGTPEPLWKALLERAAESDAEVTVLIVRDDRWQRAASLPFTHEISRIGGSRSNFTSERAEAIAEAAVRELRNAIQLLSAAAKMRCRYHVVVDTHRAELEQYGVGGQSVLIASSTITTLPLYEQVRRLECEIELVDAGNKGGGEIST